MEWRTGRPAKRLGIIEPCIPTLATKPPVGRQWIHEIKHDGYRLIARKREGRVRLFTRRGFDWTERYPRVSAAVAALPVASATVDVTNFSPKTDVFESRENLHLVEWWTRTGPRTLAYEVTVEDQTVWTKSWTVKQEFSRQSDEENRFYTEPRCLEGNYGLPGLLHGRRVEDGAFAAGRGPDPAATDNTNAAALTQAEVPQDPLQQ